MPELPEVPDKRLGSQPDHWSALGVRRNAPAADVTKAFRRLAALLHPDKHQGEHHDEALKRFQRVSDAYSVLSSPAGVAQYNRECSMPSPGAYAQQQAWANYAWQQASRWQQGGAAYAYARTGYAGYGAGAGYGGAAYGASAYSQSRFTPPPGPYGSRAYGAAGAGYPGGAGYYQARPTPRPVPVPRKMPQAVPRAAGRGKPPTASGADGEPRLRTPLRTPGSKAGAAPSAAAGSSAPKVKVPRLLRIGDTVVVGNLRGSSELNGLCGVITDKLGERWQVLFDVEQFGSKAIRTENLTRRDEEAAAPDDFSGFADPLSSWGDDLPEYEAEETEVAPEVEPHLLGTLFGLDDPELNGRTVLLWSDPGDTNRKVQVRLEDEPEREFEVPGRNIVLFQVEGEEGAEAAADGLEEDDGEEIVEAAEVGEEPPAAEAAQYEEPDAAGPADAAGADADEPEVEVDWAIGDVGVLAGLSREGFNGERVVVDSLLGESVPGRLDVHFAMRPTQRFRVRSVNLIPCATGMSDAADSAAPPAKRPRTEPAGAAAAGPAPGGRGRGSAAAANSAPARPGGRGAGRGSAGAAAPAPPAAEAEAEGEGDDGEEEGDEEEVGSDEDIVVEDDLGAVAEDDDDAEVVEESPPRASGGGGRGAGRGRGSAPEATGRGSGAAAGGGRGRGGRGRGAGD